MTIDEAGELFAYCAWANGRFFAAAEALTPEPLSGRAASSRRLRQARRGWGYHHTGIPTRQRWDDERYLPRLVLGPRRPSGSVGRRGSGSGGEP